MWRMSKTWSHTISSTNELHSVTKSWPFWGCALDLIGQICGSNAFQVYFDDAKDSNQESTVKQVSRIKESFNQESRFK